MINGRTFTRTHTQSSASHLITPTQYPSIGDFLNDLPTHRPNERPNDRQENRINKDRHNSLN